MMVSKSGRKVQARALEKRRKIMEFLKHHGPSSPGEIARVLGMAPRTVTHHLRALMMAGLVRRVVMFNDLRKHYYVIIETNEEETI